jgi:hypothetical protein
MKVAEDYYSLRLPQSIILIEKNFYLRFVTKQDFTVSSGKKEC